MKFLSSLFFFPANLWNWVNDACSSLSGNKVNVLTASSKSCCGLQSCNWLTGEHTAYQAVKPLSRTDPC